MKRAGAIRAFGLDLFSAMALFGLLEGVPWVRADGLAVFGKPVPFGLWNTRLRRVWQTPKTPDNALNLFSKTYPARFNAKSVLQDGAEVMFAFGCEYVLFSIFMDCQLTVKQAAPAVFRADAYQAILREESGGV